MSLLYVNMTVFCDTVAVMFSWILHKCG